MAISKEEIMRSTQETACRYGVAALAAVIAALFLLPFTVGAQDTKQSKASGNTELAR